MKCFSVGGRQKGTPAIDEFAIELSWSTGHFLLSLQPSDMPGCNHKGSGEILRIRKRLASASRGASTGGYEHRNGLLQVLALSIS